MTIPNTKPIVKNCIVCGKENRYRARWYQSQDVCSDECQVKMNVQNGQILLSEQERRDIEDQTLLLWIASHPKSTVQSVGYGGEARGLPTADWSVCLRRLADNGHVIVDYWARGWYRKNRYSVATMTPTQHIIALLERGALLSKHEIWSKMPYTREAVDRALWGLEKRGAIDPIAVADGSRWEWKYKWIPLPF